MAKAQTTPVFALVEDIDTATRIVEELQAIGVPDEKVEIMTALPVDHAILGRPRIREHMAWLTPIAAVLGFVFAVLIVFGTVALYPVRVGGHAYFAIPPKIVIMYEFTMLGIILGTFFAGTYWQSGLRPFRKKLPYDPEISDGCIGFLISVEGAMREQVMKILRDWGAQIKEVEWRAL